MASVFSKIVAGEIPCHKAAEDADHLAFMDINPVAIGHVLVIPKKETDYIFDLGDEELAKLMAFVKKVAKAMGRVFPDAPKIGMSVIGLDVPHAHVHLVPLHSGTDLDFGKEHLKMDKEALADIAERILGEYNKTNK